MKRDIIYHKCSCSADLFSYASESVEYVGRMWSQANESHDNCHLNARVPLPEVVGCSSHE